MAPATTPRTSMRPMLTWLVETGTGVLGGTWKEGRRIDCRRCESRLVACLRELAFGMWRGAVTGAGHRFVCNEPGKRVV